MQPYRGAADDAGVIAYEEGPGFIRVEFGNGGVYLYTDQSAGAGNIAHMKALAAAGHGLTAFISRHARRAYAVKER